VVLDSSAAVAQQAPSAKNKLARRERRQALALDSSGEISARSDSELNEDPVLLRHSEPSAHASLTNATWSNITEHPPSPGRSESFHIGGEKLFGSPRIGIAADWTPHDPGDSASCNILMLNTWHYQAAPLLCSTGGYDRCPRSVQCGEPFWSKDFEVKITEGFHNITQGPYSSLAENEQYDVVMLDWDANDFRLGDPKAGGKRWEGIKTLPHQSRSTLTMESSVIHPKITEEWYSINDFDFSYGFHNGLMTEQTSYFLSDPRLLYDGIFVPWEEREQRALVISCVGSGVGKRGPWVLEFGQKVSTHHLCALGNNAPADVKLQEPTWDYAWRFSSDGPREKVKRFRKYKFCIAYENAAEDGYATEKLYDALRSGCIPIYWGAPDVKSIWHFAEQSVIFVDDYPTMDALVDRVHQIAANKTLWESFFAWRQHPIPAPVMRQLFHGLGNIACRACVRHWQKRPSYNTRERMKPEIPDWWRKQAKVVAPGVLSSQWNTSGTYFSGP
jgi:hypothetical protein